MNAVKWAIRTSVGTWCHYYTATPPSQLCLNIVSDVCSGLWKPTNQNRLGLKSRCSSRGYEENNVFKAWKHFLDAGSCFLFLYSNLFSCRWEMKGLNWASRRFAGPTTVSVTRFPRLACCSYLSWSCEHMAEYEHLSRCHSVIAKLSKYDDLLALRSELPATRGCFRDYWRCFVWNLCNRLATVSVFLLFLILYLQ